MAPFSPAGKSLDELASREWLATNGIGGFASSSVPLLNTRKYHGLLVAAMLPPVRRMVLLARMEETVSVDGWAAKLDVNEYPGTVFPQGHQLLAAFSHEPFPRWAYQGHGWTIEKGLRLLRGENTVLITYTLLHGDKPVTLELRPLFALRGIHELSYQWNGRLDTETRSKRHHRIPPTSRTPEVFFAHDDGTFQNQGYWYLNAIHRREQERGYGGLEDLWSPGAVRATLSPGGCVRFVCSAEPIDMTRVLRDADRELSLAPSVGTPGEGWGEG
ncbi:MAG: glycogen debranching enzyme N-terminal domain-containing protein, partial [Tepidisphaeraceae bacterium]